MNLSFIINPVAGKHSPVNAIPLIKSFCEQKGISYNIEITTGPGNATTIAKKLLNTNTDAIIAAGGDGTVLEVASGLIDSNIPLGILPLGSGNDFARSCNIPVGIKNIQSALKIIADGKCRQVDAGQIKDSYFINVASVGFDAEIVQDIIKVKSIIKGKAAYFISVFFILISYRKKHVQIHMEDSIIETDIFLAAICNGRYYGGGMMINPNGCLNDGYFDLIVIKPVPKYKVPFLLMKFIKGQHLSFPYVNTYKCRTLKIISRDKLVINADGDIIGKSPVELSLMPLSLKVLTDQELCSL